MTQDTDEDLLSRITQHQPDIIIIRELANGTATTWSSMSAHAEAMASKLPAWVMVIDLTEAEGRPKGAYREAITNTLGTTRAAHIALVQPGSLLLRSAVRFLISSATSRATVHKTLDEALDTGRRTLARATGS